jgi:putative effector of murein hydrolase
MTQVPLFGLLVTAFVYCCSYRLSRAFRGCPLLNPVLISIAAVILILSNLNISYTEYYDSGARWLHLCLGPATVALAIPLYSHIGKLKTMSWPLLAALALGSIAGILGGTYIGWLMHAQPDHLLALGAKSATAPIAIGLVERAGGVTALAAIFAIGTGICGASLGIWVLGLLGLRKDCEKGFVLGISSHGIGTARAYLLSPEAGAFAGLGMALNGVLTALLYPQVVEILTV